MIDCAALDPAGTLTAAETALAQIRCAEGQTLQLAAHWADLHHPDSLAPPVDAAQARRRRLAGDYGVRLAGAGTPEVLVGCLAELGLVLQTSPGGARWLVADALDLRHRLPGLWQEVTSGRVRAWKARQVAQATRHLPYDVMGEIDSTLVGLLPALSWNRFEKILAATVKRAAPDQARADETDAATRRFVGVGRANDHGIMTLIARGTTLDVVTFFAIINRIADILALDGDLSPVEQRRSRALGILAQPARALALLTLHQHDPDPHDHQSPTADEPAQADGNEPPEPPEPDEHGSRSLHLTSLAGCDLNALRRLARSGPRVQLVVHLTSGALTGTDPYAVGRISAAGPGVDTDTGPITVHTIRTWLDRPDLSLTVRPVVIPGHAIPVDHYEIPATIRQAVRLANPASTYPWASSTRTQMDLDHIHPWRPPDRGGPPGQTRPGNLAPLTRSEHRRKTSNTWQTRAPAPGVQLWRSPHGWVHLVTNQGTYPLGHHHTARDIWHAADPTCAAAPPRIRAFYATEEKPTP